MANKKVGSDIEIAQAAKLKPIVEIAKKLGIKEDELEMYGKYKAKIELSILDRLKKKKNGKYVDVTAITPTPLGEGKTTTSVGLAMGMNKIGKNAMICIRQPSLGPVFGIKGGAAGGGYAQVVPMEDFNLHLTGDVHAVGAAHTLFAKPWTRERLNLIRVSRVNAGQAVVQAVEQAMEQLNHLPFEELDCATIDHHRHLRIADRSRAVLWNPDCSAGSRRHWHWLVPSASGRNGGQGRKRPPQSRHGALFGPWHAWIRGGPVGHHPSCVRVRARAFVLHHRNRPGDVSHPVPRMSAASGAHLIDARCRENQVATATRFASRLEAAVAALSHHRHPLRIADDD